MAVIYGALGLSDTDNSFVEQVGQRAVYDAVQTVLGQFNDAMSVAMGFFVAGTTTDFKWRYYMPGGGTMQRHNFESLTRPHAVKATGSYDVALPIDDWRDAIIQNDIQMAYMRLQELDRTLQTILIRYANTMRVEVLRTIFRVTARTFVDPIRGSLTVQGLANGDSVTYPPVIGATSEATDNHLLESGYAAASISDTNNPLVTIKNELVEHFGGATEGGEAVVVLCSPTDAPYLQALTDFIPVNDSYVSPGAQTATVVGRPAIPGGARLLGRSNGVWVAEWDWMPANYLFGRHMMVEAPLMIREDPSETGLGGGLRMVATIQEHPMETAIWRVRRGFGVTNRLNGVVMELGTGGTYTVPVGYTD